MSNSTPQLSTFVTLRSSQPRWEVPVVPVVPVVVMSPPPGPATTLMLPATSPVLTASPVVQTVQIVVVVVAMMSPPPGPATSSPVLPVTSPVLPTIWLLRHTPSLLPYLRPSHMHPHKLSV